MGTLKTIDRKNDFSYNPNIDMMQRKIQSALKMQYQRKITHKTALCNLSSYESKNTSTLGSERSSKHASLETLDKHFPTCQNTVKVLFLFLRYYLQMVKCIHFKGTKR